MDGICWCLFASHFLFAPNIRSLFVLCFSLIGCVLFQIFVLTFSVFLFVCLTNIRSRRMFVITFQYMWSEVSEFNRTNAEWMEIFLFLSIISPLIYVVCQTFILFWKNIRRLKWSILFCYRLNTTSERLNFWLFFKYFWPK